MSRTPLVVSVFLACSMPSLAAASELTVLQGPAVAADGDTESRVILLCEPCRAGGKVTAKAADAEVVAATMHDGMLSLDLRPEARERPGTVQVQVRGAGSSGRFLSQARVPVVPLAGRIGIATSEAWAEPGGAPLTLTLEPPPGPQRPNQARYAVRANIGTLGPVEVQGSGAAVVTWTPPDEADAPQRVVFAAVDLAYPDKRVGLTSVPLRVRTDLSFQVAPDSSNVLVVGDERLGPAKASPSGALAFSAPLPPGVAQATLETTTRQGTTSSQEVPLPLGEGANHLVLPAPALLPADGRAPVPVLVAAFERDGAPASEAPVVSASRGKLTAPKPGQLPGLFTSEWTAPLQTGTVEFTATRDGRADRWQATLVEGLPVVGVSIDPSPLPADAARYTITTQTGSPAQGLARTGLPRIEASHGRAAGRAQKKGGTWVLPMRIPVDAPGATVQSVGQAPLSDQPVAALLAWAAPPLASTEGAFVTVVAVDAAGLPVAGVDLGLTVPRGSGSLPPSVKTDQQGVAHLRYDLGADPSPSTILIAAAGHTVPLSVLPGNQPAPAMGSPAERARLARWQEVAPLVQTRRAAPPMVAAAPVATAATQASPVQVEPRAAGEPQAATAAEARPPDRSGPTFKPADDGERPWGRLGVDAAFLRWSLSQTAETGGVGPLALESELGFDDTLRAGFRVLLFPGDGNWGIDLNGGWLTLPQASASVTASVRAFEELVGGAGVRYRGTLAGPLGFHILGQAERTPAFLHLYEGGDPAALNGRTYPLLGARLGGGLQVDTRWFYVETTLSETFAFAPVNLRATAALDLPVQHRVLFRLGAAYDLRSMAFEVAEEDVRVEDSLLQTSIGFTIPLR